MSDIKNIFLEICGQAKLVGAEVELLVHENETLKLSYQKRTLDKFETSTSLMGGFRVVFGGTSGYAYTEKLNQEGLTLAYSEALSNAKSLVTEDSHSQSEHGTLVSPQTGEAAVASGFTAGVSDSDTYTLEDKMRVAALLEDLTLKADSRVSHVPYCGFFDVKSSKRVLNSKGLDLQFTQKYYSGHAYALAKEADQTKMDGDSFFEYQFEAIDPQKVANKAAAKAVSRLGAKTLKTGTYPVVLDTEIVPYFISMLLPHLSGQSVLDNKSLLKGQVGQLLASEKLNLVDDPHELRGSGWRPFDSEGTLSNKTPIVTEGVLNTFLTNFEIAKRLNVSNTGHAFRSPSSQMSIAPSNLIVACGNSSFEDLINSFAQVLHITQINGGLHAGYKESTGDFSLPCEGFLYQGGKNQGPRDQFVVSGNIFQVLQDILEVGDSYNKIGNSILSPSILVKQMSIAGG